MKINIIEKDPHLQVADIIKCRIKQNKIIPKKIEPLPSLQ
jgi:hypothetical protein